MKYYIKLFKKMLKLRRRENYVYNQCKELEDKLYNLSRESSTLNYQLYAATTDIEGIRNCFDIFDKKEILNNLKNSLEVEVSILRKEKEDLVEQCSHIIKDYLKKEESC